MGYYAVGLSAMFFGSVLVDIGVGQFLAGQALHGDLAGLRAAYASLRLGLLLALALGGGVLALMGGDWMRSLAIGLLAGGISSIGEDWVLIGTGRIRILAGIQILARGGYLLLFIWCLPLFPAPTTPLVLTAVMNAIAAALTWLISGPVSVSSSVWRESIRRVALLIPAGMSARLLNTSYTAGIPMVYLPVVGVDMLGSFSAADRLTRAGQSSLDSVSVALIPRMAARFSNDSHGVRARSDIRRIAFGLFAMGSIAALCVFVAAPILIPILFGPGFERSIDILQVICWYLPATALSSGLTTSVAYVRGDRRALIAAFSCGLGTMLIGATVVHLSSMAFLLPIMVVIAEYVVAICVIVMVMRSSPRVTVDRRGCL